VHDAGDFVHAGTDAAQPSRGLTGPDRVIELLTARIPAWRDEPVSYTSLSGGYSGGTLLVDVADERVVVRTVDPDAVSAGLRLPATAELQATCMAAACGAGPAVRHVFPDVPAMVVEYIDGVPLTESSIATPEMLSRVAEACRRMHACSQAMNARLDPFRRIERMLRERHRFERLLPRNFETTVETIRRLETALFADPLPGVPCHNDLHPGQIIDGGDRLYLIDFEVGALADPAVELATLSVCSSLTEASTDHLCDAYFGGRDDTQHARVRAFMPVIAFIQALWWTLEVSLFPERAREFGHEDQLAKFWELADAHTQPISRAHAIRPADGAGA
jgi:thiamine kinase-like enzyme